jgi:hypothetical protein
MDLEGQPARDACQRAKRRTLNEDDRFSHFFTWELAVSPVNAEHDSDTSS